MPRVALTVAGSDPSGGAGIQADLKTFHRFGVYGEAVLTLITVQNTRAVSRVEVLDPDLVVQQLEAVVGDIPPDAAKTGALGSAAIVAAVSQCARRFAFPLVVDPVMVSKHGATLLDDEAIQAIRRDLLPRAYLVTPNLPEAAILTGRRATGVAEMRDCARALCDLGAKSALVKGGHLAGAPVDILLRDGAEFHEFAADRVPTSHTHGTGCTYSAAITAGLADGLDLVAAVSRAKDFVSRAILTNPGFGGGFGPLNHWA